MRRVRALLLRLGHTILSRADDDAFAAEIESHLQLHIDDNVREGMTPEEARRQALLKLGGVIQTREQQRDRRRLPTLDSVFQDLRYAARILRIHPGFTATVIVTMALGTGANSAIFTVLHAVVLRPLRYPASDKLVACVQRHERSGQPEYVTWPDYTDWRAQNITLQTIGGAWQVTFNLTGIEDPERLTGAAATASLFSVFAVPPSLGRVFTEQPDEDVRTVVLSHDLWTRRFGSDPHVVGRGVELNGRRHTVIGVMPEGFAFPPEAQLWVPFVPEAGMNRGYHLLNVVGRLKPGKTSSDAGADLGTIAARAAQEYPATNKEWGARVSSLLDGAVGSIRPALLVLAAAVGAVLLIACANVAALLLARATARRHELAMRAALGAGRLRLVRQLLTESLLLSGCGGLAGVAVAAMAIRPLMALTTLPRQHEVSVDAAVVLFSLTVATIAGVCFGLAPIMTLSGASTDLTPASRVSAPVARLRSLLVAVEVGLAVVLLVGAGLLVRSFDRLLRVETGFSGDRLLTVRFFLPRATYPPERAVDLYARMVDRVSALSGVETAAAVSHFPFSNLNANVVFDIPGRAPAPVGAPLTAEFRSATRGYFQAMGIPFVSGRDFDTSDRADGRFVAIVNRAMAERFFAGEDPLEHTVRILGPKPRRIVGIVQNIRHRGLDRAPEPEIYVPHAQYPLGGMSLAIRVRSGDPALLAGAVRASVRGVDRDLPIAAVRTWRGLLDETLSQRRFSLVLLSLFAVTALALAAVGVYGVLSSIVAQRAKEVGIRMALGGTRRQVISLMMRRGMVPVVIGLLAGLAAARGVTRALTGMLYEVQPGDWPTFAAAAGVLLASSLVATLLPARRAASVDPMTTLRHD